MLETYRNLVETEEETDRVFKQIVDAKQGEMQELLKLPQFYGVSKVQPEKSRRDLQFCGELEEEDQRSQGQFGGFFEDNRRGQSETREDKLQDEDSEGNRRYKRGSTNDHTTYRKRGILPGDESSPESLIQVGAA